MDRDSHAITLALDDPRNLPTMTRPLEPGETLDPQQITSQVAALAEHLQRSGVHWLPLPRQQQVASLRRQMVDQLAGQNRPEASGDSTRSAADSPATPPPSPPRASVAESPAAPSDQEAGPTQGALRPELQPPATPARLRTVDPVHSFEGTYPGQPLAAERRQEQLDQLAQAVANCTRCELLASCRNQTVFGEGNVTPRVVFFGEGPGADEDRSGRPFVGRAGQLLTKMIEACKFQRADVYILNTVKCRPPGNRNPEPDEIQNCREYYQQQLAILRPEFIVCLGAVSAQELLQSKLSVGRLRGKLHRYFESKVPPILIGPGVLAELAGILIPAIGIVLLILLPFLDRKPERHPRKRRLAMGITVLILAIFVALSIWGWYS